MVLRPPGDRDVQRGVVVPSEIAHHRGDRVGGAGVVVRGADIAQRPAVGIAQHMDVLRFEHDGGQTVVYSQSVEPTALGMQERFARSFSTISGRDEMNLGGDKRRFLIDREGIQGLGDDLRRQTGNRDQQTGVRNLAAASFGNPRGWSAECVPQCRRQSIPSLVVKIHRALPCVFARERRPHRRGESLSTRRGTEQSAAGVAVAPEENGPANGRGEAKSQHRGGPASSRSRPDVQHRDFGGRRQTASTTLHDHVRHDERRGVVALLEVSRGEVRCLANPESRRAVQGITVVHGLGHQTVESAKRTGSQLGESAHYRIEEPTLTVVCPPGRRSTAHGAATIRRVIEPSPPSSASAARNTWA